MKVNIEETSSVERKLEIEIPWERFSEEIENQLTRISRSATLKGFRKGKAPMTMVRKIYGEDARGDAVDQLAREAVMGTLHEKGLKPFGNPYLTDVSSEEGQPLTMEAMVELEPDPEPAAYDGLSLERPSQPVTDEEVDQFMDTIRERNAEVEAVEGGALKDDNIASLDFNGTIGGEQVEGLEVKDFMVRIGKSELFPGFEEQIVGMKADETREFDLSFPDDFRNEMIAGQTVTFTVTVKEVKEIRLPEVNDDFAKTVGEFDNIEALKEAIRDDIGKHRDEEADNALKANLTRKLVDDNQFDVPPSLVDRELRHLVQQYGENMMKAGLDNDNVREMILKNEDDLKKTANEHVRLAYVVTAIAGKEGIEADKNEIDQMVAHAAAQQNRSKEELMEEITENGTLNEIAFGMVRDQVFDKILESAKIKVVEVKAPEDEEKPKKKAGKKKAAKKK
jgi:trigger factor